MLLMLKYSSLARPQVVCKDPNQATFGDDRPSNGSRHALPKLGSFNMLQLLASAESENSACRQALVYRGAIPIMADDASGKIGSEVLAYAIQYVSGL